jgi:hypothetical protein
MAGCDHHARNAAIPACIENDKLVLTFHAAGILAQACVKVKRLWQGLSQAGGLCTGLVTNARRAW